MKTKHAPMHLDPIHHLPIDDTGLDQDAYLDHMDFLDEVDTFPVVVLKVERNTESRPWFERLIEEFDYGHEIEGDTIVEISGEIR